MTAANRRVLTLQAENMGYIDGLVFTIYDNHPHFRCCEATWPRNVIPQDTNLPEDINKL